MKNSSIQQKFDTFVQNHPELKLAPREMVLSIMLDKQILTPAEYDKLKNTPIFDFNKSLTPDIEFMGFQKQATKNTITTGQQTHKDTALILLDENGNIDENQYKIENIKERYPDSKYDFHIEKEDGYKLITIINKKTNLKEAEYDIDSYGFSITKFNSCGEEEEKATVHLKSWFSNQTHIGTVTRFNETGYDWHHYDLQGNLEEIRKYEKNKDKYEMLETTYYSADKPYQTVKKGKTIRNNIVNELKAILEDKNLLGSIKNPEKLNEIINNIDAKIIYEVLADYKSIVGRDLISDIKEAQEKSRSGLNFLLSDQVSGEIWYNLKNKMNKNTLLKDSNTKVNYLAEKLIDDLTSDDPNAFSGHLKFLLPNDLFHERNSETEAILNKFKELNPSGKSLFQEILENKSIDDKEKAKLIPQIALAIGVMLEKETFDSFKELGNRDFIEMIFNNYDTYCEDIKADFELNKNNPEKMFIDLKRLVARSRCNNEDVAVSKPNGKIDIDFKQGNTGDCWLLAGLASVCKKDKGRAIIESLLKVDETTGNVTVTLKGVNKTYTITQDEIENSDYLSGGDGDIRALELAFDKYIRESAYSDQRNSINIDGNTVAYLYEVLLGKAETIEGYSKSKDFDFNSESDYYCLGTSACQEDMAIFENIVLKENGTYEDFVTGHAYAIIKSDNQFVYIINPWNSKETLRITHEDLTKIKPSIGRIKTDNVLAP